MDTESIFNSHIARQPVFTAEKKRFGYELLFRDGEADFCPDVDVNLVTAQMLFKSILSDGFEDLTRGKPDLINLIAVFDRKAGGGRLF